MGNLNLKLKDGIDPSVLLKYGFIPKYDEDSGKVKMYLRKIHIDGANRDEKHFTFELHSEQISQGHFLFRRTFTYQAWMSMYSWSDVCEKEAMQLLYDLIIDGIVEPIGDN